MLSTRTRVVVCIVCVRKKIHPKVCNIMADADYEITRRIYNIISDAHW